VATSLKRIEKEFILSAARDEGLPLLLFAGSGEWPVKILEIGGSRMTIGHSMPMRLLKRWQSYEFRFVYREQAIAFQSRVVEAKEGSLVIEFPELVYKNLGRRYSRRRPPLDFTASFGFMGDRYDLAFPRTPEFDPVAEPEPSADFDAQDIRSLVREFNDKSEGIADERAIVMFKDRKPESQEERAVVRTGHIFYLPTAMGGLPSVDPYIEPRLITRENFADYLRERGVPNELVEEEVLRFERGKKGSGVLSELMIPVIFQEYVIGYVSLINRQAGLPPFDLAALETFHQFAKVLAYSLKINGYFKNAPKKIRDFSAEVIDVSAGGILFATPSKELAGALLPGSQIELTLKAGGRNVRTKGILKRNYRDSDLVYYGVEYLDLAPEDFRFLFETLYGRPFTDGDATGLEGLGVKGNPRFSEKRV
jgi:hypothetical protein